MRVKEIMEMRKQRKKIRKIKNVRICLNRIKKRENRDLVILSLTLLILSKLCIYSLIVRIQILSSMSLHSLKKVIENKIVKEKEMKAICEKGERTV